MVLTPKALTVTGAESTRELLSGDTDKEEEAEDIVNKSNTFESTAWDPRTSTEEAEGRRNTSLSATASELASRGW